jgi:hypothetical protein
LDDTKAWLKENTNIKVSKVGGWGSGGGDTSGGVSGFGIPRGHNPKDVYCCVCAERHSEEECPKKYSSNQRYQ